MKYSIILSLAFLLIMHTYGVVGTDHFSQETYLNWMNGYDDTHLSADTFQDVPLYRKKLFTRLDRWAKDQLAEVGGYEIVDQLLQEYSEFKEYPYFNFFPNPVVNVIPDGLSQTWSSKCYKSNVAQAVTNNDGSVTLTITASDSIGEFSLGECGEYYRIVTVTGWEELKMPQADTYTVQWTLPADVRDAEVWDLYNKGLRIMKFAYPEPLTLYSIIETLTLFFTEEVSVPDYPRLAKRSEAKNADFYRKYTGFPLDERDPSENVDLDESDIPSGALVGILRLDGLGPMEAFGEGSTQGHAAITLWIDGELYICESQVKGENWPTNGVQKTPYKTWMQQAEDADYNVVIVPLSDERQAMFNETRAVEWFRQVEGYDYGYRNYLYSWIDTQHDNYPCLPPDFSSNCLTWELLEPMMGAFDRLDPDMATMMWGQAFNLRLDTLELRTAEIFEEAANQDMDSSEIAGKVEQDSWMYETTRFGVPAKGPSMVCCVFVASLWKNSGVFDDLYGEVMATEMTNYDVYAINIFEGNWWQVLGDYTMTMNDFNTKIPYKHMDETCPTLPPLYEGREEC